MKIETFEKYMWAWLIAMVVLLLVFLFRVWEKRDAEIMAIDYCFQELADGSLYHYVCEK